MNYREHGRTFPTSAPTPVLIEYLIPDHPREGAPTFTPPRRGSSTGSDHCSIEYAAHGWPVFPLNAKVPFKDSDGVLDATTDLATIVAWWSRFPYANIGGQIPASMIMIDIDPYHGGRDTLAELERQHVDEPLPLTLVDYSGRGDGGAHYWFRRPAGKLSATCLGPGIDLKTSTGYAVLPPSIHPDTGRPYVRVELPVAAPPAWFIELLRPAPIAPRKLFQPKRFYFGPSIADEYSANASWSDILEPHGWRCRDADPDADGARWLHPAATSACSATVRHGCLFVWSPNTVFDISEPSYPKGYTRFRGYALLNHDGDMSAAARALTKGAA